MEGIVTLIKSARVRLEKPGWSMFLKSDKETDSPGRTKNQSGLNLRAKCTKARRLAQMKKFGEKTVESITERLTGVSRET
ncbi:MAG: hypothetical protein JW757_06840 [Anaerolineales bacterium]|nr:hypothetical protein [Anaerolineales bacterium]